MANGTERLVQGAIVKDGKEKYKHNSFSPSSCDSWSSEQLDFSVVLFERYFLFT